MQQINLTNAGPQLTWDDLDFIEDQIGGQLPDDYKSFMLKSNGGMADPYIGFVWKGELEEVPGFFCMRLEEDGISAPGIAQLRDLGFEGLFPFTGFLSEDDICLDFLNEVGTVWLATYHYNKNDVVDDAKVVKLANSFTEFLDLLVPLPVCPIRNFGKIGTPEELEEYLAKGNSIEDKSENDVSLLIEAIRYSNMPLLKACIQHNANLVKTIRYAMGAEDCFEILPILVKAGADVNEMNEYGRRPLYHVGGTSLPGEEGEHNRKLESLLIEMGAVK